MRYIRQPDEISCGPVAILNALKWAGLSVTSEHDLPKIRFACKTVNQHDPLDTETAGTYDHDFDRTLRYVGAPVFDVKRKNRFSFKSVKEHLLAGGAVCIGYWWQEGTKEGAHFAIIERIEKGLWVTVNDHSSSSATKRRKEATVRKWLADRKSGCPSVWFLTLK